jgi:hypothetical protein
MVSMTKMAIGVVMAASSSSIPRLSFRNFINLQIKVKICRLRKIPADPYAALYFSGDLIHFGGDILAQQPVCAIADQDDHCNNQGDLRRLNSPVIFQKTQSQSPPLLVR